MAKEIDLLSDYGEQICDALGFNPTSNSTKPLSVANGLFRLCLEAVCDVKDIHEWIVSERRINQRILSSDEIRNKYKDILTYGTEESIEEIKEARFFLEQIFNPDSTVYPSYLNSVLNIPSRWLVRDQIPAEAKIGDFLYEILNAELDGKKSVAIELLNEALKNDEDDISRLIKPILTSTYKARISNIEPNITTIHMNKSKLAIRKGFDTLASNLKYTGQAENTLLVLQKMINYAMFSTYFYLIDVNSSEFGVTRIPLLLDSSGDLDAIVRASEQCFIAGKKSVEAYIVNTLEMLIQSESVIANTNNIEQCRSFLRDLPLKSANENNNAREALLRYFDTFSSSGEAPLHALAHALQFAIYTFTYPNNTPSDFCRVLGTRAGLVGPGGNATKYKRLLINRFLLDTIVMSTVNMEEMPDGIELRELGEAMREQYCILIGADTDKDYSLLEEAKIAQDAPEDLRGELASNARGMADMLISLGLAKRYADGVTIIGWRL